MITMEENYDKIHLILTGGTIDSTFNPTKDGVEVSKKSRVSDFLKKLKLHNPIEVTKLFMKDSREIGQKDREQMLDACKNSPHKMILITHGTYTMPDSAQYLKSQLQNLEKTIVLTGSMVPLSGFEFSDAAFNLGYAISAVQKLSPGVYVCMNGKIFDPQKVNKNRIKGRFEEVK